MNQVFYQNSLLKFIRSKKGKALDLASGNETFVKLLLKNNWYVDSVDLKKNNNFNKKNYTFNCIDLEKTKLSKIKRFTKVLKETSNLIDIKINLIVKNETDYVDNAVILIDNKETNQTYSANGTYNVYLKPGKYEIKVSAERHRTSIMNIYIPPQDSDLSLIDYSSGLEGVNRFTFELEEGEGTISLDENTYLKMLNWCPILILLFSLVGVWGSWVTYTLQSYKNAQIGAFFSIMAMGFLIIGPLLGVIALILLPKIKKHFTGHFKK